MAIHTQIQPPKSHKFPAWLMQVLQLIIVEIFLTENDITDISDPQC